MLAELDVDAAVAEAELLEAVGGAEVGVVLGAVPGGGVRLEAPEGVLVVEGDGGGGDLMGIDGCVCVCGGGGEI